MQPVAGDPRTPEQLRAWKSIPETRERRCDALVVGAGISACAAALTIARAGFSVALVEAGHMVGGQSTSAGVSAFDITFRYDEAINGHGVWGEIVARIMAVYRDELKRPVNAGHYNDVSITPNVVIVERVLSLMLEEAGVEVLRNTDVTSVNVTNGRVQSVETSAGTITTTLLMDGTELGALAGMAGVDRYIGNALVKGTDRPDVNSRIQDITYTCTIRRYPEGIPGELRVTTPPPGYEDVLEDLREHFPPDGVTDPRLRKAGPNGFAGYRAAPDFSSAGYWVGSDWTAVTRTNLNYRNDTPTAAAYLYDSDVRDATDRKALHATLSILFYLQNELGLDWAPCTDEGYGDGINHPALRLLDPVYHSVARHFPVIPYIRESSRIVGMATLTGKDINRSVNGQIARWNVYSIATGTYPPDLHGGREPGDFEPHLNETLADKPVLWREGPFPIPLGCLVPAEVDGYIALEKNISASRIAAAACRLHPTAVGIGQAGGTLAVAALTRKVEPRRIPPAIVQWLLARAGALITPLAISGADPACPDYPAIAFAVARNKVAWTVGKSASGEQAIVTDLEAAASQGRDAGNYVKLWLGRRATQIPAWDLP
ncbi:hypothetical protein BIU82_00910 [Arthrobacter sp. SW1]|uniref:FAD-dependent oxidoreductase n=1 Tax=Arthrobacter sp. SW1 TaxID=1920889 RepID=UPI000877B064|nr:FAD-dependent oxidoreductase [Arthrobacter sp. SW1]OFI39655.1 hypothetical protein BIU82_00910 [Arthrobacter sp. SW1]